MVAAAPRVHDATLSSDSECMVQPTADLLDLMLSQCIHQLGSDLVLSLLRNSQAQFAVLVRAHTVNKALCRDHEGEVLSAGDLGKLDVERTGLGHSQELLVGFAAEAQLSLVVGAPNVELSRELV